MSRFKKYGNQDKVKCKTTMKTPIPRQCETICKTFLIRTGLSHGSKSAANAVFKMLFHFDLDCLLAVSNLAEHNTPAPKASPLKTV